MSASSLIAAFPLMSVTPINNTACLAAICGVNSNRIYSGMNHGVLAFHCY